MILPLVLAAAVAAPVTAAPPPPSARAAVEAQARAPRAPGPGISGEEARRLRQIYLQRLGQSGPAQRTAPQGGSQPR